MTSAETVNAAADQTNGAVQRSAQLWQQGTRSLAEQAEQLWQFPQSDSFNDATRKYFEYLQDGLEVNKNVAMKWIGALTSISDAFRDQLGTVTDFQQGHAKAISTWISSETETFEDAAKQQAEQVDKVQRQQAERVQQAQQEQQEQARQAQQEQQEQARQADREKAKQEREQARRARQEARERYEGLTKVELADKLAERGLPKTGNVDELVDRLVSADSN
jgi:NADH dehydrogenase/NADH:ubiquinone oxidoreductase subunit G